MNGQRCLSASFSTLCQVRDDVMSNDLAEPLARLFSWDAAMGKDWLFDCDVTNKEKADNTYRLG